MADPTPTPNREVDEDGRRLVTLRPGTRPLRVKDIPEKVHCVMCDEMVDVATEHILYGSVIIVTLPADTYAIGCICGACRVMPA